jgi:hypothetical protein
VRFGEDGYTFSPGLGQSLLNNPKILLALSIYITLVSVVTAIAGVFGGKEKDKVNEKV